MQLSLLCISRDFVITVISLRDSIYITFSRAYLVTILKALTWGNDDKKYSKNATIFFIFCGLKFKHWKFQDWNYWDFRIQNFGIVPCFKYFRILIPTLVWMPDMKANPDGTLQHDSAGHQHVGPHVLNLLYHETLVFF